MSDLEAPISPVRQAWLMLVVIAPMAACYPAIKLGLESAPPLLFGGLRTLIGGLALLVALLIRRKPLWPEARLARWILPLGLLATTLTFGAMFASPAYVGAGIASVLGNTQPLIIVVLAALFLSEKIGLGKAVALGLGLAGVALLALPAFLGQTSHSFLGVLLALASSASAAFASVLVKRLSPGKDLMALTAWQLVVGSIVLLGFSAVFEPHKAIAWNGGFIGILLFLAFAGYRSEHVALVLATTTVRSWPPVVISVPGSGLRTGDFNGRLWRTLGSVAGWRRGSNHNGRRAVRVCRSVRKMPVDQSGGWQGLDRAAATERTVSHEKVSRVSPGHGFLLCSR